MNPFDTSYGINPFDPEEEQEQGLGFWEGLKSTVDQYYTLGRSGEELIDLLDGDIDDVYLEQAISKINEINESGQPTQAMLDYQKAYEEEGGDFLGAIKAIYKNPGYLGAAAQQLIGSLAGIAGVGQEAFLSGVFDDERFGARTGGTVAGVAGASAAAGAGISAGLGAIGGPVASGLAGLFGATSMGIGGAYAATQGILETTGKIAEILTEKTGGELTKEKIRAILDDPEQLDDLRSKAIGRGIAIGATDFAAQLLGKGVGKKFGKEMLGSLIGEIGGGAGGEAIAQKVAGEEFDPSAIVLEASGALMSTGQLGVKGVKSLVNSYNINKQSLAKEEFKNVVEKAADEDIAKAEIFVEGEDSEIANLVNEKRKKAIEDNNTDLFQQLTPSFIQEKRDQKLKEIIELENTKKQLEKQKANPIEINAVNEEINDINSSLADNEATLRQEQNKLSTEDKIKILEENAKVKYFDRKSKSYKASEKQREIARKRKEKAESVIIMTLFMDPNQGVKQDSVERSQKTQEVFDKALEDGKVKRVVDEGNGKTYNQIDGNTFNEIMDQQAPLINKVAKDNYSKIPNDLRIGSFEDYKMNLQAEVFKLLRTYNPEAGVPLAAYLNNPRTGLPVRAMSKDAFENIADQEYTRDIDDLQVAETETTPQTVEDQIDIDNFDKEVNAVSIADQLNLDESVKSEITRASKLALATTKQKVDSLKFTTDIANSLKNELYPILKETLGKNTKNNRQFSNLINNNAKLLYDSLRPESMVKARDGKLNPFEEAGMLKDGKKVAFEQVGLQKFKDYFDNPQLAKENKTKANNRRMAVLNSLAESLGAVEAENLLANNVDGITDVFVEKQKTLLEPVSVISKEQEAYLKIASTDIDSGNIHKLLDIEKITIDSKTDIKAKQEQMLDFIKTNKIPSWLLEASQLQNFGAKTLSRPTKQSPKYYVLLDGTSVKGEFVSINKNGVHQYRPPIEFIDQIRPSRGGLYNGKKGKAWLDALAAAKENDKFYDTPTLKRVVIPKKIEGNEKATKNFLKENQSEFLKNQKASDLIVKILDDAVNKNGAPIELASLFITGALQATSGWIKTSAPITHIVDNFEHGTISPYNRGIKTVEEHTPPANVAGLSLIAMIKFNQVNKLKPKWNKNFFQVLQSKKNDQSIAENKLTKSLPEGVSMLDDNAGIKRMSAANLDLNKISNVTTNETIAEEMNVKGPSTPDGIEASNNAVLEDNFELLIERAIQAIKTLQGDPGSLQTNIAAIPSFLLINSLRTVKLAYRGGKTLAKAIEAGYNVVKDYLTKQEYQEFVQQSVYASDVKTGSAKKQLAILNEKGVAEVQEQARQKNKQDLESFGVEAEDLSTKQIIDKLDVLKQAKVIASNKNAPVKKARVFDFDDTLAQSKSNVLYTLPDGTSGKLNATEFATRSGELTEAGAEFDFSEFSKVIDGQKGPLALLAKKLVEAKGDRDVFVLTARPAEAAQAIKEFLRAGLGISIPIENITGLADGKPGAKAFWMANKVAEGYNDIFFADDAPQNVAAVNKMLNNLGVKNKTQIAKEPTQASLEDQMDSILRSKEPTKGSLFRKFNVYVPPGADDFAGLLYTFLGKGKIGEAQMKFFQDNIMTPFAKGISAYESSKVALAKDYKELSKRYKNKSVLKETILDGLYTKEQAVRAYNYDKTGQDLGINETDKNELLLAVMEDENLLAFADELSKITKIKEGYPAITEDWLGGNIQTDLANVSNKAQRAEFLQEFLNNKDQVFSAQNMKLIGQMHGNDFTDALKNVLERMSTGINRKKGKDKEFNAAMNWLNQSVANVMAVNIRSAVLQQLSIVNFMNWTHNNPYKFAKAISNTSQFSSDFMELINSDFLTDRRGGQKIEINTADLANSEPGNYFLRVNKKLLELGFKPTQWGDSFAIAFGGATWYRNRIDQLIEGGMDEVQAKEKSMLELQEIAEETQQSSRPDRISRQQASDIGRLILAFANTPLQYARLTKKATLDLINGRGDWRSNASKIVYYGVAQNLIFSAMQSALFSMLFDETSDDEDEKRLSYYSNGVLDGFLRGMGYSGAAISALKNLGMEYISQQQRKAQGKVVRDGSLRLIQKGLSISPPLSKKIGDIVEAQKFENWRQYKNDPFYNGFAKANYLAALTNVPLDRAFKKAENLKAMDFDKNDAWQNLFLALGWSPYQLNIDNKKKSTGKISFSKSKSISNTNPFKKVKDSVLPHGALGRANKDGSIEVSPNLKGQERKEVIAHEKQHMKDMKAGILNYDDNFVYYKKKKFPRVGSHINYNGKFLPEGHSKLPWEARANKAEKTNS